MRAWSWRPPSSSARPPQAHPSPTSWPPTIRLCALGNPYLICNAIAARRSSGASIAPSTTPAATGCCGSAPQALAAIHRADPDGIGLTQTEQLAEWRDRLDEMGDTTATFEWAFRWLAATPAAADPAAARARRFPDGQPDRRRVRPGRRAGLGTRPHRRGLRGPGLVLHPGLAVRRAGGARRGRPRQRRELSCPPTRRPRASTSTATRSGGG